MVRHDNPHRVVGQRFEDLGRACDLRRAERLPLIVNERAELMPTTAISSSMYEGDRSSVT